VSSMHDPVVTTVSPNRSSAVHSIWDARDVFSAYRMLLRRRGPDGKGSSHPVSAGMRERWSRSLGSSMLSSSAVRPICQKSADWALTARALRCVRTSCLAVSVYPCKSSDWDSRGKWALRCRRTAAKGSGVGCVGPLGGMVKWYSFRTCTQGSLLCL
jgi:hypothetical protein